MSNQPSACFALGDDAPAIGDQSIDQRDVGAVGDGFDIVREGHVARHEDVRFDTGRGGVGGKRAGGIAGGRDGELCAVRSAAPW